MRRRYVLAVVLALAVLTLGVTAAPAPAEYPVTGIPGTAYVHIWWGSDPIVWEEDPLGDGSFPLYSCGDSFMWPWATDPLDPGSWCFHKDIPGDYNVCLAALDVGTLPRGAIYGMPNDLLLEGAVFNEAGQQVWAMGTKEARRHWLPVQSTGWMIATFNRDEVEALAIGWVCDLGVLPAGDYNGTATYIFKHQVADFGFFPEPEMKKPVHAWEKGTYVCPDFTFTIADEE